MFHLKFIGIMLKAIVLLVLFVGAVVAVLVSMWRKVWHRQHLENELSSLMALEVMTSDSDELSVFHSVRDFSFHSLVRVSPYMEQYYSEEDKDFRFRLGIRFYHAGPLLFDCSFVACQVGDRYFHLPLHSHSRLDGTSHDIRVCDRSVRTVFSDIYEHSDRVHFMVIAGNAHFKLRLTDEELEAFRHVYRAFTLSERLQ